MTRRRSVDPDALAAVLDRTRVALPGARACWDLLVASLAPQLSDLRRARDVGRIIDAIARMKLYRLGGHATLDAFLRDALGISRTTAYRLRRIARVPHDGEIPKRGKRAAYEAARGAASKARTSRPSQSRSRAVPTR